MALASSRVPLTRAEHEELVRRGVFEDARVELLDGRVVAKARVYAAAGVTEYWIVNLIDGVLEVHRQPAATWYASVTRHGRGEAVHLQAFADVQVRVADVLPPPPR